MQLDCRLWSVRRLDSDLVCVEVRNRQTWRIVSQVNLDDPFGESSFDLYFHPRGQYVALWAAAGQDGLLSAHDVLPASWSGRNSLR